MSQVYIKNIRAKKIEKEIKAILTSIGYLPKNKKIFIKPNVCGLYKPNSPCIVNPRVVGGVIEYLKDNGYRDILIGELPVPKDTDGVFTISGYRLLSKKYNVKLTDLSFCARGRLELGDLSIELPELLLNNEYEYINIAKMKTHIQTKISLCTKNQKGLVDFTGRRIMHVKGDLHENIKLLGRMIKPDFCIIDSINALEGDGPGISGTEIMKLNVIILGESMDAVDWVGAQLMGIEPVTVRHLSMPREEISIIGENMEEVKREFLLPKTHFQKFNIHFWVTDKTCSGCSEIIGGIKKSLIKSPICLLRFLWQAFFGRIDILTGGVDIPDRHGKLICLGDCMEEKCKLHNLSIIKGCPPDVRDFLTL